MNNKKKLKIPPSLGKYITKCSTWHGLQACDSWIHLKIYSMCTSSISYSCRSSVFCWVDAVLWATEALFESKARITMVLLFSKLLLTTSIAVIYLLANECATLHNQNTRCWNEITVLVETFSIERILFGYLKNPFYLTINRLSSFELVLKHIQNIHKVKWIWKHWGTFWKFPDCPRKRHADFAQIVVDRGHQGWDLKPKPPHRTTQPSPKENSTPLAFALLFG